MDTLTLDKLTNGVKTEHTPEPTFKLRSLVSGFYFKINFNIQEHNIHYFPLPSISTSKERNKNHCISWEPAFRVPFKLPKQAALSLVLWLFVWFFFAALVRFLYYPDEILAKTILG